MKIDVSENDNELGEKAARKGAGILRAFADEKERLALVIPTGASQLFMFEQLIVESDIPWDRIDVFHLDEYVGISPSHTASFRRYLRERFVAKVPNLGSFHEIAGDALDVQAEISRLNDLIGSRDIDLCFAGIGENGHLAFNDPPADFETNDPYILVKLDEGCRRQQHNEGWFENLGDVPDHAISMSVNFIMKSRRLIISVPDARKAEAVRNSLEEEVSPRFPASILQRHDHCDLFLDRDSSKLLRQ